MDGGRKGTQRDLTSAAAVGDSIARLPGLARGGEWPAPPPAGGEQRDRVSAWGWGSADAQAGQQIFSKVGCAICHVSSISTTSGTLTIGEYTVPDALKNKTIHPYGDFLLHNIGTGDGIVQNGPQDTANKLRTAPLWGLRTRDRFMHDGLSVTLPNAIGRHRNEASDVIKSYYKLSDRQKSQLLAFLNAL